MQYILLGNNPSYTKVTDITTNRRCLSAGCGLRVAYGNPQVCYLDSKVKTFNSKTRINSDVSAASQHYSKNTINFQLVYGLCFHTYMHSSCLYCVRVHGEADLKPGK